MRYQITDKDLYISKSKQKNLNLFWLGYIMYIFGYEMGSTLIYFNIVQMQMIQFAGIAAFVYAAANIIRFDIKNGYLKAVYILYLLVLLGVMGRGFVFDFFSIKESLVNTGYGLFIYLVPLFLLFPVNFAYYRKLFQVIFIFSIIYLVLSMAFIKDVFNPDRRSTLSQGIVENFAMMSFCSAFTLLTYIYHSKTRKLFAFVTMFAMLLFAVYRARRGMILMSVTNLLCILIVYLIITKRTAMVAFIVLIIAIIGYFYYSSLYNQSNFGPFNFLIERSDEDTRTGVEDAMKEDMSSTDWLIGKGTNGEYYCPSIDELDQTGYRTVVETGYLQIILKGGIIALALNLLIFIPALIKGFKGKNILSKAAGFSLLMWIAFLYPTVGNTFSMTHIIAWISVGICFSPKITNMTDAEVFEALQEPKKAPSRKQTMTLTQPEL